MTRPWKLAAPVAAMLLAAPAVALAQNGYTTDDVNMRAGPGVEYPAVATIPEDSPVRIVGCLDEFNWCDVGWRGNRGWVNANLLTYAYNNRYVAVDEWGPRIGVPVVGFAVRDYWGRYYRDRPFYSQRETWFDRGGRYGREDWRMRERRDGDDWRTRERRDTFRDGGGVREERREGGQRFERREEGQRFDRDRDTFQQRGQRETQRPEARENREQFRGQGRAEGRTEGRGEGRPEGRGEGRRGRED